MTKDNNADLTTMFQSAHNDIPDHMAGLWEQQKLLLSSKSKNAYRWHPKLVFSSYAWSTYDLQYKNIKGTVHYGREMDDNMGALDWKLKSPPPPPPPHPPSHSTSICNKWDLNSDLLNIHISNIIIFLLFYMIAGWWDCVSTCTTRILMCLILCDSF